jgi:hypothetical protein
MLFILGGEVKTYGREQTCVQISGKPENKSKHGTSGHR